MLQHGYDVYMPPNTVSWPDWQPWKSRSSYKNLDPSRWPHYKGQILFTGRNILVRVVRRASCFGRGDLDIKAENLVEHGFILSPLEID